MREAIREVVDIGLLVSKPYKGLFVREITRKDLEEIYSLRTMLKNSPSKKHRPNAPPMPWGQLRKSCTCTVCVMNCQAMQLLLQSWNRLKPNLQFYFTMYQQAHDHKGPKRRSPDLYIKLAGGDDLDAMLGHLEDHIGQGLETTISFIAPVKGYRPRRRGSITPNRLKMFV